jgi:hypothetical protein
MARKRYNEEDILRLLREIEVHLHGGMDVVSACLDPPIPTPLCKKKGKHAQPPALGGWLGFGRGAYPNLFLSAYTLSHAQ